MKGIRYYICARMSPGKNKTVFLLFFIAIMVALLITELLNMDNKGYSSQSPFFPVQKDIQLTHATGYLEGTLILDEGYIRIRYPNGETGPIPIWPHGYSLHMEAEETQILNSDDQLLVRIGEHIKLGGGEIPAYFAEEKIGYSLPNDCTGPFFLTSGLITLGLPSANNSYTGPDPNAPLDEKYKENPSLIAAEVYAQHYGVSVDEASHRLELQNSFPGLQRALINNESETFGGLWIQHEPEYKLVIAFTRDGEATLNKYRQYISAEIAPYIEIRKVDKTYAELLQAQ